MTDDSFDVPEQPSHVLQVVVDADGVESGRLDGEPVAVAAGTGVHRALIVAARAKADRQEAGRTIRVVGRTGSQGEFHMAIGPDGRAWEVPPPRQARRATSPARATTPTTPRRSSVSAFTPAAPEQPASPPMPAQSEQSDTPAQSAATNPAAATEVPDDIAHVIVLHERSGKLHGTVDDDPMTLVPGDDPYEQLIRAARRRADEHAPGRTVRVLGRTPDGRVWHMALDPDGTPRVVPPAGAPTAHRPTRPTTSTTPLPAAAIKAEQAEKAEQVEKTEQAEQVESAPTRPNPAVTSGGSTAVSATSARTTSTGTSTETDLGTAGRAVPQPQRSSIASTPLSASPAPNAARTPPLQDEVGRPIPTTTHVPAPDHEPAAVAATPPPEDPGSADPAEPADERSGNGVPRRGLLIGAGAALLLGGAGAAYAATRGSTSPAKAQPSASGTGLPDGINSPAGLPDSYIWSQVDLADAAPQLVVDGDVVVCTTNNDATGGVQLIAVDAGSGQNKWKSDLPVDAIVVSGPKLVPIDGQRSVVIATRTQIMAWPLSGGTARTWPVEQTWSTQLTASGVIVTRPGNTERAYVLYDGKLTERAISSASRPVALLSDGTLIASNLKGQVWKCTSADEAPKPTSLQAPSGTTPGAFVAATANQIITAFVPQDAATSTILRSFALPSLDPVITTKAISPAILAANFQLAPDESWAVAGNSWVDMSSGNSRIITSRWSPLSMSQYNAWSKSGSNILTATDTGKTLGSAESGGQTAVPYGGTETVAFCAATVGGETTLYAVPIKS